MGEAFNFGTGEPVSVLQVFREMAEVAERPYLEPEVLGEASKELQDQFISSAKARRLLGWQTQVQRHEGLQRTFRWYHDKLSELEA